MGETAAGLQTVEGNVRDIRAYREAEGVRRTDREKTEKLQAEKWQT
jgi:hypothetical protein